MYIFNKQKPKVYVMMRIYQGKYSEKEFKQNLHRAIDSVINQKYKNKALLLYFDGEHEGIKDYIFNKYGSIIELHAVPKDSEQMGSAYGTLALRREFLRLSSSDNDAVSVSLDQDDQLRGPRAIDKIMLHYLDDEPTIFITNFKSKSEEREFENEDHTKSLNSIFAISDIHNLDSLGWTKSYNKKAMEIYCSSLENFFEESDLFKKTNTVAGTKLFAIDIDINAFFKKHTAYEDFIDYILLLRNDIKTVKINEVIHTYYRNENSITGSLKKEEFISPRLSYLCLLLAWHDHIAKTENECLRNDSHELLYKYILYKVNRINDLLKEKTNKFKNGNKEYSEFAKQDLDSFFEIASAEFKAQCPSAFIQLEKYAEGHSLPYALCEESKKIGKKKKEIVPTLVPVKEEGTVKKLSGIIWYTLLIYFIFSTILVGISTTIDVIIQILDKEPVIESLSNSTTPELGANEIDKTDGNDNLTQNQEPKQDSAPNKESTTKESSNKEDSSWLNLFLHGLSSILINPVIFGAALITGIFGFYYNKSQKKEAESKKRNVYNNEFEDFIRHIEAGARVLLQLVDTLEKSQSNIRPSSVHFVNLKVPSNSILLSNDPILNIGNDNIHEMARIKVNIRNINNSAIALEQYSKSHDYCKDEMLTMIRWEISRYFGYLATFKFFQQEKHFPDPEELDIFIDEQAYINKFSLLFMDWSNYDDVEKKTRKYLENYKIDRRKRRSVILFDAEQ